MAGIGIELRRLTQNSSLWGVIRANLYSAILSSGSWVISISFLLLVYFFLQEKFGANWMSVQFLVAVTYLTSFSLIISGLFQQVTIRYIADRLFEHKEYRVAGFMFAVVIVLIALSVLVGIVCCYILLPHTGWEIRSLMISAFVSLNLMWIFANALSGLKEYRLLVFAFFLSYLVIFFLAMKLYSHALIGLLTAYYIGQSALVALLVVHFIQSFPTNVLIHMKSLRFFKHQQALIWGGFLVQLAFWIDKYEFWFSSQTGLPILDGLWASPIYDLPMFVAFLSMIPGLAVFFYEIEAHFSFYYHRLYDSITQGATFDEIRQIHREQVMIARESLLNVVKIQAVVGAALLFFAPEVLRMLHLSPIAVYILRLDLVSVFLAVMVMVIVNLLYYLNKSTFVAVLVAFYFILNALFTYLTLQAHPAWYGYGFLGSSLLTLVLGVLMLNRAFSKQVYETFMMN